MRYRVKGIEIHSHNAAKPIHRASRYLAKWITSHPRVESALDLGCGKLRYAAYLQGISKRLTLVDSEEQIDRIQTIDEDRTTVRDYARARWRNTRVLTVSEFYRDNCPYDFILCANVLSAIPCRRIRSALLLQLASRLKSAGECLFVTQYTNSYFGEVRNSERSVNHMDGWIVKNTNAAAYFGVLPKYRLMRLVARHGFQVVRAWVSGQSAYVLATGKSRTPAL